MYVFLWWLIAQALGWVGYPLAYAFFRWLPDRGYSFSKIVGLLLASYLLWIGASAGILRNDAAGILFAIALAAAISLAVGFRSKKLSGASDPDVSPLQFLRSQTRLVVTVEILFTLAFILWVILRSYAPDKIMSAGGEKFMEIAFLNGVLNSRSFPPLDPWLSGFSISYYYFGYVMMALVTKLSGAPAGVGFDLYDALLFALTIQGAFGVVYNLIAGSTKTGEASRRKAREYGLAGALFVTVLGNLEGVLEIFHSSGLLPRSFWSWIDIPGLTGGGAVGGSWFPGESGGWWWWRASRVLQDHDLLNRPLDVSPITEFPFFSFLLGDNHPHVLALPFVLLAIGVAFNLLRKQIFDRGRPNARFDWPLLLFAALFLGALGFLNTWDLPIYLGLAALAYAIGLYARWKRFGKQLILKLAALGISLFLASLLLYFFFYISFHSQAGGVLPYIFPPTRLPQYLVMFGTFVFILTCFLAFDLSEQAREGGDFRRAAGEIVKTALKWWAGIVLVCLGFFAVTLAVISLNGQARQFVEQLRNDPASPLGGLDLGGLLQTILLYRLRDPWLMLLLSGLLALNLTALTRRLHSFPQPEKEDGGTPTHSPSHLFAYLLLALGLLLTFSVEFFYLRDQFGVRMNTVFKFYFQGWVMLGCASAYVLWWMLEGREHAIHAARSAFVRLGSALLILAGLAYPLMGYYSRVQGFQSSPDLNGEATMARWNPDDWAAIEWLRQNGRRQNGGQDAAGEVPIILEAPGKSYNYEGRISAFTGFPAVLGWALHEGQWRGSYDEQARREADIASIYSTYDSQRAAELLRKWEVRFVIVGSPERQYVEQLCSDPSRSCSPQRALAKFDLSLEVVFSEGSTTVYRVPDGD